MISHYSPVEGDRRTRLLNVRLAEFGTTVFAQMSALAIETGSINLGQGFPDTDGPQEIKAAAIAAIEAGHNQYPPGRGIPELLSAVAEHQRRFYQLDFDPRSEVLITAGATEAITATILALCEPGDEVVVFEPYYDSYVAAIAMAGAERRVVSLRGPEWSFDPDELRAAIGPRTRLLLLNSPHNPTGKVFSREELTLVADISKEHDLLVVTDEVYEHLVFDGEHIPLATLPGMSERTITISSAGKTFSFTGWKIGWVCASEELISAIQTAKQYLTYVNGAPFQYAIATGLALPAQYFRVHQEELCAKRDLLQAGLAAIGFDVLHSSATYFLTTDISHITDTDADAFCLRLPQMCRVVAVPVDVFYDNKALGKRLVRWAFCKRDEVLIEALDRLQALNP